MDDSAKSTYHSFEEVPKSEYLNVYELDINKEVLTDESFLIKLTNFASVESIYFSHDKSQEVPWEIRSGKLIDVRPVIDFPTEFACMQQLSHIGGANLSENNKDNIYIYQDKMIIIINDTSTNLLPTIQANIKYLNIISKQMSKQFDFINFPNTLEHIHISTYSIEKFKQTNLPPSLKTFSVTISQIHIYLESEVMQLIISNCKVPHGCDVKIIFI